MSENILMVGYVQFKYDSLASLAMVDLKLAEGGFPVTRCDDIIEFNNMPRAVYEQLKARTGIVDYVATTTE
jgi:hypothetical protein